MSLLDALLLDPSRINVWLALRSDGNKGSGTQSDPYNAGTAARFDGLMNSFGEFTTVRLGPGLFETKGFSDDDPSSGWQPKAGMKIIGSGIDVTTLRLVGAGGNHRHYFAIGHALASGSGPGVQVDFFEASDFTVDCNLNEGGGASFARGAIRIKGNHARIRRIKAKEWGTKSSQKPCVVFSVIIADPDATVAEVQDAGISECVVITPASGTLEPVTFFHAGGKDAVLALKEAYGICPFIRDCFADGGQSAPSSKDFRGLSMDRCMGGIVEGNQIHNCKIGGPYQENTNTREITVRGNFYNNVSRGPYWNLGQLHTSQTLSSLIRDPGDSSIAKATTSLSSHGLKAGERVKVDASGGSPAQFKGVFVIKDVPEVNQFRYQMVSAPAQDASTGSFQKVMSVARLIAENNSVELAGGSEGILGLHLHDAAVAGQAPDHVHGDIIVRNNKISYVAMVYDGSYAGSGMELNGAEGLRVEDNTVDVQPANPIRNQRCGAVTYFNNKTPTGVLIQGFNDDTDKRYDELETEAEDALVLALLNRG